MAEVAWEQRTGPGDELPAVPVSASALIFDQRRRLLVLRPTYKPGWTIPGGVMENNGETPWQACQREVLEECGLELTSASLACVDFRPPRPGRSGGVRFLFHCGQLDDAALRAIRVQSVEVSEHRLLEVTDALVLLRKPIRRRVRAAVRRDGTARQRCTIYLEDGRPVAAVRVPLARAGREANRQDRSGESRDYWREPGYVVGPGQIGQRYEDRTDAALG